MALESINPAEQIPNILDVNAMLAGRPSAEFAQDELIADEAERSRLATAGMVLKTTGEIGIVTAEVTPLNEALRVAAAVAAQAKGLDPIAVGAVYGAATMFIEGAATFAAADLLHREKGQKFSQKFAELTIKGLGKIGITVSDGLKLSPTTHVGIGLLGGSAPLLMAKNVEDSGRTKEQDRKYGLRASAGMAGACAIQGYLTSKAIEAPDIRTIGTAVLAVGGMFALFKPLKNRIKREEAAPVEDAA